MRSGKHNHPVFDNKYTQTHSDAVQACVSTAEPFDHGSSPPTTHGLTHDGLDVMHIFLTRFHSHIPTQSSAILSLVNLERRGGGQVAKDRQTTDGI